eukprot:TRINITY_DN34141_c0_g1_i1.p1 TRINITY_DN34141_c0_g1~~TRINITY_DN34141_c0_g1_i1.p1  ORF type:complete len:310 (+),score=45.65 TRINITY_DN34141_c0_g1_i1:66-995(+)
MKTARQGEVVLPPVSLAGGSAATVANSQRKKRVPKKRDDAPVVPVIAPAALQTGTDDSDEDVPPSATSTLQSATREFVVMTKNGNRCIDFSKRAELRANPRQNLYSLQDMDVLGEDILTRPPTLVNFQSSFRVQPASFRKNEFLPRVNSEVSDISDSSFAPRRTANFQDEAEHLLHLLESVKSEDLSRRMNDETVSMASSMRELREAEQRRKRAERKALREKQQQLLAEQKRDTAELPRGWRDRIAQQLEDLRSDSRKRRDFEKGLVRRTDQRLGRDTPGFVNYVERNKSVTRVVHEYKARWNGSARTP